MKTIGCLIYESHDVPKPSTFAVSADFATVH